MSSAMGSGAYLLIPAATGSRFTEVAMVFTGFAVAGMATGVSNVLQVSFRQSYTPDRLLGRMTASYRFVAYGTVPVGAMLGGVLGAAVGLRPALFMMAAGLLIGPLFILLSPLPRRRVLPPAPVAVVDPPRQPVAAP